MVFEQEIQTWRRELPRLLEEGHAGRHAILKGDEVVSIWDTHADATQAGYDRFGLEPVCIVKIDPRDPERFRQLDAHLDRETPICVS